MSTDQTTADRGPAERSRALIGRLWVPCALAVVAVALTAPVLSGLGNWGNHDWDQHFFYYGAARKSLVEFGELGQWNPWYCGGAAGFANPQSPLLSLTYLMTLVSGVPIGLQLSITLHAFLGMWGGQRLARSYGCDPVSSMVGGIAFMGSSVFALHVGAGHSTWLPMAYLPWAFYFYRQSEQRITRAVAAGVAVGLMLLHGAAYLLLFSAMALALWAAVDAGRARSAGPLLRLAIAGLSAFAVSAIKLVPLLFLVDSLDYSADVEQGMNGSILFTALLDRDQGLDAHNLPGQIKMWWEYGAYVGAPVLLLALIAVAARLRKLWPTALLAVLFLWFSGGSNFGASQVLLSHLPGSENFRLPSRLVVVSLCLLAVLAACGLSVAAEWIAKKKNRVWALAASGIVTAVVTVDLLAVSWTPLGEAFPRAPRAAAGDAEYAQSLGHFDFSATVYSDLYERLLENQGVVNCYEVLRPRVYALPRQHPGYSGEAFFYGNGRAHMDAASPSVFRVTYETAAGGVVVLNQNAAAGWDAEGGVYVAHRGLVAAAVGPGTGAVTFSYRAPGLVLGAVLSLIGLLAMAVFLYRARR